MKEFLTIEQDVATGFRFSRTGSGHEKLDTRSLKSIPRFNWPEAETREAFPTWPERDAQFPFGAYHYSSDQCRWVESDPRSISDWADAHRDYLVVLLEYQLSNNASKKIASFIGRLTAVSGDTAFVTALSESTGEHFEAECETSFLREKGIEEGMEFRCTVTRKEEQTVVEFEPLPPKVLSEKYLEEISREVDSRLK